MKIDYCYLIKHQVIMHLALAYAITAIIFCIPIHSSLSNPTPSVDLGPGKLTTRTARIVYTNITRTIGGETILFPFTSCTEPVELDCSGWCLQIPVSGEIQADCLTDCDDDYCTFGKIEFPTNSGNFVDGSELIMRAREERLASLHAQYLYLNSNSTGSTLQKRDLAACLAGCRTFAQFAGYIPYRVARVFASGLAHTACPALCYSIAAGGG
jgi:hypothetical protein